MMSKDVTLKDIGGYATEKMVWQMMLNLSQSCDNGHINGIKPEQIIIDGNGFILKNASETSLERVSDFSAPETFGRKADISNEKSEVWTLGALAFFMITGTNVFDGKGGKTQQPETEIPRLSSAHANHELSDLVRRCLSFYSKDRPTKEEIRTFALIEIGKPVTPRKKITSHTGKKYTSSLICFWPEEMVPLIVVIFSLFYPMTIKAQPQRAFDKSIVPNEMANLVLRCIDLRMAQNAEKVSKAMDRDLNWTMMDELPIDKNGECTTKDIVDVFGLNDIGFRILKRHGGITNSGGRFRDGRDPRYKYSFIEITVKKGATVTYPISGREGEQIFAIVPYDKNAQFTASIPNGKTFKDNNVCYIQLKQQLKKEEYFTLTIKNISGKNLAFAIINYNSRNNE